MAGSLSRANASCILHTCMEIQPRFQIIALSASTTERFLHNVNVQNPGRHARAWGAFVYQRRMERRSRQKSGKCITVWHVIRAKTKKDYIAYIYFLIIFFIFLFFLFFLFRVKREKFRNNRVINRDNRHRGTLHLD